ncbi:MAG: hypothetical protein WAT67_00380 [Candidatus Contendobacter sp.]
MPTAKEAAKQVIDRLPDQASWADILYELYVKRKIATGLMAAMTEGKTVAHKNTARTYYA